MTREEIVEAVANDKLMPFIQPEQLNRIVDFVVENYKPELPANLDEAAVDYANGFAKDGISHELYKMTFIAGAKWMAGQGYSYEDKVYLLDGGDTYESYPGLDGEGEEQCINKAIKNGYLKVGDKVIVQIRKKEESK